MQRKGAGKELGVSAPWPLELRLPPARDSLVIGWDDGRTDTLSAEYLRVESPSAEVQGHGPREKRLVSGKRGVTITALEPVGNYAVRIIFGDGHGTGIYTWPYLRELADEHDGRWRSYVEELAAQGATRDS